MKKAIPISVTIAVLCCGIFAKVWLDHWRGETTALKLSSPSASLGQWRGANLRLQAEVVDMLAPDKLIYRRYTHPDGEAAELYGIFYVSQGVGRTMHSPLNCYPGSGWEVVGDEEVTLQGLRKPDVKIDARKLTIQKGETKKDLYFWYYAGGRIADNQYMNKALTLYGAVVDGRTDGALVTISTASRSKKAEGNLVEEDFVPRVIDYLSEQPISH